MKEVIQKINDLIVIMEGYPKGSRGYVALDWAIKNLAIAHDRMELTGKQVLAEDMHWEKGL
jgi:hypothetical protein